MEELHQSQLDKLIGSQTRARISMEKSHTKLLRKASKNRGNVEVMQQRFKLELQELLVLQDGQVSCLCSVVVVVAGVLRIMVLCIVVKL